MKVEIAPPSCVPQELRELTRLDGVDFVVDEDELEAGATPATEEEIKQHRVKKRLNQLLRTFHSSCLQISSLSERASWLPRQERHTECCGQLVESP